jgi:uncharacterized membrane protein/protein-disulfide isomerase
MTKKIYILAFFLILALAFQIYLTKQFYSVQYGVGLGESVCNINQLFNCDSVALSKYSNVFGIPNAVLGIFLNIALLIGLLGFSFNSGAESEQEKSNWLNFYFTLSIFSLITSLILAGITLFVIKKICIFCAALYVLSILTVVFTKVFFPEAQFSIAPFIKSKTLLGLLVSIPLFGGLTHLIIKNEYSPKSMEREINAALTQWKDSPTLVSESDTEIEALFVENKGAQHKIVEFADFLCPHCATAHQSLSSFLKTHENVEFHFYAYPLDANCNAAMDEKYSGLGYTCTLAKGVFCAGKLAQKAKEMHHEIFENQKSYAITAQSENNSGLVKRMSDFLGVSEADLESCVSSSEAQEVMLKSTKLGQKARVMGTPTIYLNGKKLPGGANFLMLKRAFESL